MFDIRELFILINKDNINIYTTKPEIFNDYHLLIRIIPTSDNIYIDEIILTGVYNNKNIKSNINQSYILGEIGNNIDISGNNLSEKLNNIYNLLEKSEINNFIKFLNYNYVSNKFNDEQVFTDFVVIGLSLTLIYYDLIIQKNYMFNSINTIMPPLIKPLVNSLTLNLYIFTNYYTKAFISTDSSEIVKFLCNFIVKFWEFFGSFFFVGDPYNTEISLFNSIASLSKNMVDKEKIITENIKSFNYNFNNSYSNLQKNKDDYMNIINTSFADIKDKIDKMTILNLSTGVSVLDSIKRESNAALNLINSEKNTEAIQKKCLFFIDQESEKFKQIGKTELGKLEDNIININDDIKTQFLGITDDIIKIMEDKLNTIKNSFMETNNNYLDFLDKKYGHLINNFEDFNNNLDITKSLVTTTLEVNKNNFLNISEDYFKTNDDTLVLLSNEIIDLRAELTELKDKMKNIK